MASTSRDGKICQSGDLRRNGVLTGIGRGNDLICHKIVQVSATRQVHTLVVDPVGKTVRM